MNAISSSPYISPRNARFSRPTPCSPVIDPPKLDAEPQDVRRQPLGAFERAGLAAIEQDQRVQVAVAGMKHVGDAQAVARLTIAQCAASASPSRVRGTTPSCTMKSGLMRPTAENAHLRPFQMRARSRHRWRRACRGADGVDDVASSGANSASTSDRIAFELDDEDGGGPGRIAGIDRGFGGVDGEAVHDLHRARQQARSAMICDTASPAACSDAYAASNVR